MRSHFMEASVGCEIHGLGCAETEAHGRYHIESGIGPIRWEAKVNLADNVKVVLRYWRSVVAVVLGALVLAATATLLVQRTYTATTSIFFSVQAGSTAGELASGSTYAERQVNSYAEVARAPIVLEPVINTLSLDLTSEELAKKVTVDVPTGTAITNIEVVNGDPDLSAAIANEIGRQLVSTVQQLSPTGSDGSKAVQATVITPASIPTEPTSPKVLQNLVLGLLLGILAGVGQAVLRDRLDRTIRRDADVAEVTDVAVVGNIGFDEDAGQHPLILEADPHSPRAEAYRRLRTNLQFLELGERSNSIVVTSSIAGEGKSTTSINIASTLAEAGQTVLLIDADLRRPQVAEYLQLDGSLGLTTVLIGRAEFQDVVQRYAQTRMHVLTSGQVPPNPSEMLGSEPMKRLLHWATETYDMVIIDSPPLLPVTDSAILSKITGGALIVVGCGAATKPQLAAALDTLHAVEGTVLGLVVNKVRESDSGQYGYGYSYRYHREPASVAQRVVGAREDVMAAAER